MLFNSLPFAVFLPLALLVYWPLRDRLRSQNLLIVALSYTFYGFWDWRFLSLLLISTVVDYIVGIQLARAEAPRARKVLLAISAVSNLGILGIFKYYGFFVSSLIRLLHSAGMSANFDTLHIVLPVGISFYTFQTMSYSIDVYRRRMPPTRDFIALAAYVSFFPQLVAGPIERGRRLLPQVLRPRRLTREGLEQGFWLILLGFVRKSVLADNVAILVDRAFDRPAEIGAWSLFIATVAFAVQIYCDFSGYSNMARGVAKWFGFDLMVNFRAPYCSTSIQEFWRRWHVSLSTWLRDYLYIPLGGNAKGSVRTYVNLTTTMLLGGLWHGAAWNFVAWGGWQGLGLVFHRLFFRGRSAEHGPRSRAASLVWTGATWTLTFFFVLQGWLLFRVRGMQNVVIMSEQWWNFDGVALFSSVQCALVVGFFLVSGLLDYVESRDYERLVVVDAPLWSRTLLAGVLLAVVAALGSFRQQPFLYFQF